MEIKNETVTLSLETYEEMKNELKDLREQAKQKTVIKYYHRSIYEQVALVILFGLFMWFTLKM
jgi:hypothetical protein